jgi:hypothetical protein
MTDQGRDLRLQGVCGMQITAAIKGARSVGWSEGGGHSQCDTPRDHLQLLTTDGHIVKKAMHLIFDASPSIPQL